LGIEHKSPAQSALYMQVAPSGSGWPQVLSPVEELYRHASPAEQGVTSQDSPAPAVATQTSPLDEVVQKPLVH
jgi:hypothetical protein